MQFLKIEITGHGHVGMAHMKVECKFCGNLISYHKDRMLFHLGYRYEAMCELVLHCVQRHIHEWKHYLLDVVDLSFHH
jgi:hypothetical protein